MSRRLSVLALASALIGGAAVATVDWRGRADGRESAPAPAFDPEDVLTVQARPDVPITTLGGEVVASREVTLTAQLGGQVRHLAGPEGSHCDPGQVLADIDTEGLQARRRAAIADLQRAEADLRNAHVQYQRQVWVGGERRQGGNGFGMFDQMLAPMMGAGEDRRERWVTRRADVHASGTRIAQARAAVTEAASRIQEIDAQLGDARSVAPFPGVILERLVEQGDTVTAGQPLLRVADPRRLQVKVEMPDRLARMLSEGVLLPVLLDVDDTRVPARVARVFPMADPLHHTVTVKLDLAEGAPATMGMYAEVELPEVPPEQAGEYLTVPASAISWRDKLPMVYVLTDDRRTEMRLVRLGRETREGYTILSGLQEGDEVIADAHKAMARM
jgi:multidrug efflux pump subunit AcrA (membrane-fusion protein)